MIEELDPKRHRTQERRPSEDAQRISYFGCARSQCYLKCPIPSHERWESAGVFPKVWCYPSPLRSGNRLAAMGKARLGGMRSDGIRQTEASPGPNAASYRSKRWTIERCGGRCDCPVISNSLERTLESVVVCVPSRNRPSMSRQPHRTRDRVETPL